jgi:hypothetical protein
MKRIQVKKQGILTHEVELPAPEADAWLAQGLANHWFGKPEVTEQREKLIPAVTEIQQVLITEAVLDEDGEVVEEAVYEDQEVVIEPERWEFEKVVIEPAEEFEVVITDITQELEQRQINAEALAFLQDCDWKRQRHLSQKALGITPSLTDDEYLEMEQECQAARDRIVR